MLCVPGNSSGISQAFFFPLESVASYAEVRPLQAMRLHAFTLCFWVRNVNRGSQTIFSYSTLNVDKELVVTVGSEVGMWVGGQFVQFGVHRHSEEWLHHCVTWASHSGTIHLWVNGVESGTRHLQKGYVIQGGGMVILGKEKDSVLDIFTNGFSGWMSHVNLWSHILEPNHIKELGLCKHSDHKGNVIAWGETPMSLSGGVIVDIDSSCT